MSSPHYLIVSRSREWLRVAAFGLGSSSVLVTGFAADLAKVWVTQGDRSELLAEQSSPLVFKAPEPNARETIEVNPADPYQSMDGFGFALTGGSAQHLIMMSAGERWTLLNELFSREKNGIGLSYLRVSIGASDLNERVFSYDDLPEGQTDVRLEKFNLSDDRSNVVPVLKEILKINPSIKILGSPWSAPTWMKTNHSVQGGKLKEEYYDVYAQYLVKYIAAMAQEGIPIDAITVQNEPFNDGNTPSMQVFAKEEDRLIKNFIGPRFRAAGIKTKIILYDHNCDAPEYPISILTDPEARQYIDGSGFHLYEGPITAMSKVHAAFPEKNLYFTEIVVANRQGEFNIADPTSRIVVGATRNWSKNVLFWNLAADSQFKPHTDNGGCSICQGAITIDGDKVERNVGYYAMAHVSKFVPMNSVRIGSTASNDLPNVAFKTPGGHVVLLVSNPGATALEFNITFEGKLIHPTLPGGAVATYVW